MNKKKKKKNNNKSRVSSLTYKIRIIKYPKNNSKQFCRNNIPNKYNTY